MSIGIAESKAGDLNEADLFKHADKALYYAKASGRNQCIVFEK